VAGSDALHAKIARGVAGELQHLSAKVFADSSHVHGRGGANAAMTGDSVLQMPVDAANWELNQHRVRSHGLPSTLSKHNSQLASNHLVVMACHYLNTIVFGYGDIEEGDLWRETRRWNSSRWEGEDGNILSCLAKRRC
jgi:hypothetical protein